MSQTEGKLVQGANCTKIFLSSPFKSTLKEKMLDISSLEQHLSHWVGPIPIPKKDFELFLIKVNQNMMYKFCSSNLYYSMKTVLILKPESLQCAISLLKRFLLSFNENYIFFSFKVWVIEVSQFSPVVTHARTLELPIRADFKATRSVAKFFTICCQISGKYRTICRWISHQICQMTFYIN